MSKSLGYRMDYRDIQEFKQSIKFHTEIDFLNRIILDIMAQI